MRATYDMLDLKTKCYPRPKSCIQYSKYINTTFMFLFTELRLSVNSENDRNDNLIHVASTFSVLELIEIVLILWVYYTMPLGFILYGHFLGASIYNIWNYFVWFTITNEGSVPSMRIWFILLIKSDLKWFIHLSRSILSYFNFLVSVTADGPVSTRGHM